MGRFQKKRIKMHYFAFLIIVVHKITQERIDVLDFKNFLTKKKKKTVLKNKKSTILKKQQQLITLFNMGSLKAEDVAKI